MAKSLSTSEIRRAFLDFFVGQGHTEVPSASLVPAHDPTLLFTNAGMVQFKDVFTGKETRAYRRATTTQKCVRAGGKHNDLEVVGYTARHHTFFEMLGNFSFGDYFKKEAIEFAWELITRVFEIPATRLCVTVFAGEDGIPADEEAEALWQSVGVPKERIFRCSKKDNYWQMGDTGPQGPCTEIHYFTPEDMAGALVKERVEQSDGWVEIWNLVFMQFVRETVDGPLAQLPKPCVDTGAGLERLAQVMQKKNSNYEIDLFQELISRIAKDAHKSYREASAEDQVSMRVIADHARATTFLIADGVMPDRDGRGYVLRRIMRRAIRHGRRLGFDDLFLHKACAAVIDGMENAYPDIRRAASLIEEVAKHEEAAFRRTLDRGLKLLSDHMRTQPAQTALRGTSLAEPSRPVDSADSVGHGERSRLEPAFVAELYDTYGFPIDLTRVIAEENGFGVDEEKALEEVRRRQAKGSEAELTTAGVIDRVWFQLRDSVGPTKFIGYGQESGRAKIKALLRESGEQVERASAQDPSPDAVVLVVLNETPFYGEAGGQVGDVGGLEWQNGRAEVLTTTRPLPEIFVHRVRILEGVLSIGDEIEARVDIDARSRTRKNHSATHLLHLALKEILGEHVQQKGSLVAPDRLRFDYAHFEPLTSDQIRSLERRVNAIVLANAPTETQEVAIEEARRSGAVMLFGEKYGDQVRMVRIGSESLELCGGTHVRHAGEIGLFKILSDASIASGVRRIEATTGLRSLDWVQSQEELLRSTAESLKATPDQIPDRVDKLLRKNRELERDIERVRTEAAVGSTGAASAVEEIAGIRVLFHKADGTPKKSLRALADRLRDQLKSGVVVLTAAEDGKVALLVAATADLADRVRAGDIVKTASEAMAGSGGGRADFAQGGGSLEQLASGLEAIRTAISATPSAK